MIAPNFEAPGADAAEECLNTISNAKNQAESSDALLALLDALSGDGEIAKGARRGATVLLINVIERGIEAIRADRVKKKGGTKKAGRLFTKTCLDSVFVAEDRDAVRFAIITFLNDIAGSDPESATLHGAAEVLAPVIERGIFSSFRRG